MSNNSSSSSNSGIGFVGLLTIVFITLKLTEIGPVATWSWWWVLSPIWISMSFFIVVVFLLAIFVSAFKNRG